MKIYQFNDEGHFMSTAERDSCPEYATTVQPTCPYPKWNGTAWVTDNEKFLADVRATRNRLLDEADLKYCNAELWEAMTAEKKAAWKSYKQALRDLPASIDPSNPVWPERPAS